MIDSLLQKWSGDFLNAIRELKIREIYYQIMAANSYWLQTNRECKIVCVNLKEELKKGKPSPYDWTAKTNQNTEAFPMEDSIKSQSQAVYQADGANTFAGLDKVYGLM